MSLQYIGGKQQLYFDLCNSVDECQSCARICIDTMNYCLRMGGEYADSSFIRLLRDCAEMCEVAADQCWKAPLVQMRNFELCAELCERSAWFSGQFYYDPILLRCAANCRQCASYCRGKTEETAPFEN